MELRWYQRAAIDATNRYLAEHDDNPCIVIPTGGGKTPTMAAMIREYLTQWPGTRIIVLAHVRELVEQNATKAAAWWPEAPLGTFGVYSAGMGRRDTEAAVIFASVQSVYQRALELGRFDLVFVDESHRIPIRGEGMYRQFLADQRRANPDLRVIGFTATPYRLDAGMVIGPDYILNGISFEVGVRELIEQGYLCPIRAKGSETEVDLSGVSIRGGEYVAEQLEAAMDQSPLVEAACREMLDLARDRHAWIVFAAGVSHARHITETLNGLGVAAGLVTGETDKTERARVIHQFQSGDLRALVNVSVLTEGFDATHIDCVAMLRPTKSPGLYYQMLGRGLRLDPKVTDCLVLDFAGNVTEHGPIDQLRPPRKGGKSSDEPNDAPVKRCPACAELVHASLMICPACQYAWPEKPKHADKAGTGEVLSSGPERTRYDVTDVLYSRHDNPNKPLPTLRVDYYGGYSRVASEWICLEHDGFPRQKAERWWADRDPGVMDPTTDIPTTVDAALELIEQLGREFREPTAIETIPDGRFTRIVDYDFTLRETPWLPEAESLVLEDDDDVPF